MPWKGDYIPDSKLTEPEKAEWHAEIKEGRQRWNAACRKAAITAPLSSECGVEVSSHLKGATILNVGIPDPAHLASEGGGLVIDFMPKGETSTTRLLLSFNGSGIWVSCMTLLEASQEG